MNNFAGEAPDLVVALRLRIGMTLSQRFISILMCGINFNLSSTSNPKNFALLRIGGDPWPNLSLSNIPLRNFLKPTSKAIDFRMSA